MNPTVLKKSSNPDKSPRQCATGGLPARAAALVLLLAFASPLLFAAATGDPLPPTTGRLVDYTEIQDIFDKRCVECHEGDAAPNALNLIDTRSYNLLFDEASQEVPNLKRVKPGNAEQSYLFQKINQAVPKSGTRMPVGFTLPVAEQVAIRDWINQGALPVNRNPILVKAPTLTPASPRAGEGTRFSVEASDPNSDPITISWDFGDGVTATGANVVHTYAAIGTFNVLLTVKDNRNGERLEPLQVTVIADADTDADGIPNLTDADDDADGFTDGIELAAQTDPLNAASTPLGGSTVTPGALTISQFKAKFDFKKSPNDSLSARVIATVPDAFTVSGQALLIDLGGVVRSATFDAKGEFANATDSMKLKVKKQKTGGLTADISLKLKASLLAESFLGVQKASESDAAAAALPRAVSVFLAGTVQTTTANFTYKRKKSGPGSSSLAK